MNEVIRLGVICDQFGNLQRGGAEAQVENTIAALQKTGLVSVEYITHETTDLSKFDLIHFFKSIYSCCHNFSRKRDSLCGFYNYIS